MPSCRHMLILVMLLLSSSGLRGQIAGRILSSQTGEGLEGCTITAPIQQIVTQSDASGNFALDVQPGIRLKLIFSYSGFATDSMELVSPNLHVSAVLHPQNDKAVVVVSGSLRASSKSESPVPVEVYHPAFFRRNPNANIFEALGMVNGVMPQVNCNVCNTGDIHINGLEGPYTMVLIDGMPIVSSLSTVYGLSGIPSSLVKRIEVIKGPAGALYGSDAMAGLINVITRDGKDEPRIRADIFTTSRLETNADLSFTFNRKNRNALLGVNLFSYWTPHDINSDGFTDVTQQRRGSAFYKTRWKNHLGHTRLAGRLVYENRWGGQLGWNPALRGSDSLYAESILTQRAEVFGGHEFRRIPLFFDFSFNTHRQDAWYGLTRFFGLQHTAFAQLLYKLKTGAHHLTAGLPVRWIWYDDNSPATQSSNGQRNQPSVTRLPGLFVQDEWMLKKWTLLGGLRLEHHNVHGSVFSPRLAIKHSINRFHSIRLSSGTGFRVVNLFTEDHAALSGARSVVITEQLKPEQSVNVTLNYLGQISFKNGYLSTDVSIFQSRFSNRIVGDFMTDPQLILYKNLNGRGISRGISVNIEGAWKQLLRWNTGITLLDVFNTDRDSSGAETKKPQLFAPSWSGTWGISLSPSNKMWSADLSGRVNGPMLLPVVPNDFRPDRSPVYTLINLQVNYRFRDESAMYFGVKNLLNFIPRDPILRPFDPFDKNITVNNPNGYTFDPSYNYAPVQGIKFFVGYRKSIR